MQFYCLSNTSYPRFTSCTRIHGRMLTANNLLIIFCFFPLHFSSPGIRPKWSRWTRRANVSSACVLRANPQPVVIPATWPRRTIWTMTYKRWADVHVRDVYAANDVTQSPAPIRRKFKMRQMGMLLLSYHGFAALGFPVFNFINDIGGYTAFWCESMPTMAIERTQQWCGEIFAKGKFVNK